MVLSDAKFSFDAVRREGLTPHCPLCLVVFADTCSTLRPGGRLSFAISRDGKLIFIRSV